MVEAVVEVVVMEVVEVRWLWRCNGVSGDAVRSSVMVE